MAKGKKQGPNLLETLGSFQVPSGESLLKAQPRLIVLLGIVPTAAAATYAWLTSDGRGWVVAGLLLGAAALFFAVQAVLAGMGPAHWGALAGVGVAAIALNQGAPMRMAVLSFLSLLGVVVLALKGLKGNRERLVAGVIAGLVWLGTAQAPVMVAQHRGAEASMIDVGARMGGVRHALWLKLTRKTVPPGATSKYPAAKPAHKPTARRG